MKRFFNWVLIFLFISLFSAVALRKTSLLELSMVECFAVSVVSLCAVYGMYRRVRLERRSLASCAPCGIYRCDTPSGRIAWMNDGFAKLFGYESEEILPAIHSRYETLIHPEDLAAVRRAEQKQLRAGDHLTVEHRALKKSGEVLWILKIVEKRADAGGDSYCCALVDISKQKSVEQSLRLNSSHYKIALEQTDHILFDYDPINRRVHHPEKAMQYYNLPKYVDDVPQTLVNGDLVHPDFTDEFIAMYQRIHDGEKQAECTVKLRRSDGTYAWNQIVLTSIFDDRDELVRTVGVIDDITRQKEFELNFEKEKQYRNAILSDSLFTFEANISQDKLLQFPAYISSHFPIHPTTSYTCLLEAICETVLFEEDAVYFMQKFSALALRRSYDAGICEITAECRLSDSGLWALVSTHLFEDASSRELKAITYMKDIDKQKRSALYLKAQAERDPLTGLYNKGMTHNLIASNISSFASAKKIHALFIVDIDNFKDINDTFGHLYGDAVLSEIADKLQRILRSSDIVGRIGGDEFAVFLKDIDSAALAEKKAGEINQALRLCYTQHKVEYPISSSIGIAIYPDHGTTFEALYKNADIALYQSKDKGKDTFTIYSGGDFSEYRSNRTKVDHIDTLLKQTFKSNMSEYIFRILYSAQDKNAAVTSVLELIGKHYNVSRGYIFENSPDNVYTSNTFEWCNEGVSPQIDRLQNLPFSLLDIYQANANSNGFYIMHSLREVPDDLRAILEPQGIKSMMHFSIRDNGVCRGFIGFDDCREERSYSKEEIHSLYMVTNIISSFLLKMRTAEAMEQNERAMITILNNLSSYTYVVEPDTYKLLFVNAQTLRVAPDTKLGSTCYQSFFKSDTPCKSCPLNELSADDFSHKYTMDIYNPKLGIWSNTTVSWLTWTNGNKAHLINCVDISKYVDAPTDAT